MTQSRIWRAASCHKDVKNRLRPSIPVKVKDFQFGHEHFDLFESDKALLHFCSIYM